MVSSVSYRRVSTLKCAGWVPHDGLFEWEWIAGLQIERKSLRSNSYLLIDILACHSRTLTDTSGSSSGHLWGP
jgi:hypothetical protein